MPAKRRRSSGASHAIAVLPATKKIRTTHPLDRLSDLSDEILLRILHNLPISTLLQCQRLSHKFYTLASDSQLWKSLYYSRFVLPRALRIPGIRSTSAQEEAFHFASRRSKWLDEDRTLVNRADGKKTNWKGQYKLRHNWARGACEVQEIRLENGPSTPAMLVKLADGVVVTADRREGLRVWELKGRRLLTKCSLEEEGVPTCLAIDEGKDASGQLGVAIGFLDGGWGIWRMDSGDSSLSRQHRHPKSSNGRLVALAFSNPYVLTITDGQLLSLYTFDKKPQPIPVEVQTTEATLQQPSIGPPEPESKEEDGGNRPQLLASLTSHTTWPPLSLSLRITGSTLIASIAYTLPTYLSGYTIGLQELHLCLTTHNLLHSRLTSAQPQGFHSILASPTPQQSDGQSHSKPTSLAYSHPYILATNMDNTLTLYLCTSTAAALTISPGTRLWGHTSSVSSAEITARGKAVSVSTRGNELRVWELEGSNRRKRTVLEKSVQIRTEGTPSRHPRHSDVETGRDHDPEDVDCASEDMSDSGGALLGDRKKWVGFDDEVVIVLKESGTAGARSQALMIYDFT
ncbi:hypothetical protein BP5796_09604 [Coleophoma crateriformis]|uniref:F-box domain-containing protein n=1 Tax=Coleophoma crateriformis TaxID=565419 RepID=A0A3D8QYL6_9HELO|nr:hypothetical protein BP5796_09604 [Coleophoma crateriformis]